MNIHSECRIHHPRERVYLAYRDDLPAIARDYIPDVREIRVHSREERDGVVVLHNEWIAHRDIPALVSRFLKPEMLRWDDFATWVDAEHHVDWKLRTRVFTEKVRCAGRNSFRADGEDATLVVLTGELHIDLRDIPGVPSLLAGRLAPVIEDFIVQLITPNLVAVNRSLERYLDDRG
jgi:hypothetical protein